MLRKFFCVALLLGPALAFPQEATGDNNARNTKPVHDHLSNKDVNEKLRKALDNKNAAYAGSNIEAVADDQSVTLSGTVQSSMQHEMALQMARAYAGNRKIVDKIAIQ